MDKTELKRTFNEAALKTIGYTDEELAKLGNLGEISHEKFVELLHAKVPS